MKKKKKLVWNSPVVLCFAALSFAVMVLNLLTGGLTNRLLFTTTLPAPIITLLPTLILGITVVPEPTKELSPKPHQPLNITLTMIDAKSPTEQS